MLVCGVGGWHPAQLRGTFLDLRHALVERRSTAMVRLPKSTATAMTYRGAFATGGPRGEQRMQAGQTIAGKYRLNRILGTGGMATVWSATNLFTDRDFAVKVMLPQRSEERRVGKEGGSRER